MKQEKIPIWQKYTLSIEEAAEYFRIGQGRLRELAAENPNADFLLSNGNRIQINESSLSNLLMRQP